MKYIYVRTLLTVFLTSLCMLGIFPGKAEAGFLSGIMRDIRIKNYKRDHNTQGLSNWEIHTKALALDRANQIKRDKARKRKLEQDIIDLYRSKHNTQGSSVSQVRIEALAWDAVKKRKAWRIYKAEKAEKARIAEAIKHVCVTGLKLGEGEKNNYKYNGQNSMHIGFWGVDSGGGFIDATTKLGNDFINLSAKTDLMDTGECIDNIMLKITDWGVIAMPPTPRYKSIGYWDVDDSRTIPVIDSDYAKLGLAAGLVTGPVGMLAGWGIAEVSVHVANKVISGKKVNLSIDSFGNRGNGRMTLFVEKINKEAMTGWVLTDIKLLFSNIDGISKSGIPMDVEYKGTWDVDKKGCNAKENSCSEHGAMLLYKRRKLIRTPNRELKKVDVDGEWKFVMQCRGGRCDGVNINLSVGVENGETLSKGSTLSTSLSAAIRTGVKADTGALPGGEVSAEFEFGATIGKDQTTQIDESFTRTSSKEMGNSCSDDSSMWQWNTYLDVTWTDNNISTNSAKSSITVCAGADQKPSGKMMRDSSWNPDDDNYHADQLGITWSTTGRMKDKTFCVHLNEPEDPHSWDDNYLCFDEDIGAKWTYRGQISSMDCTQVNEANDPDGWDNNYFCLPKDSRYKTIWHVAGTTPSPNCEQIGENKEPGEHSWSDNYLCIENK